jgi:tetratricopeptide (TPR) repeat protein
LNTAYPPATLERLQQASGLLVQRRPADAAEMLRALKREQPGLLEARRLLGLALREMGDLAAAEREFRDALVVLARPEIYEALAATLEAAGRRPEALEAYRKALGLDPKLARAAIGLSELLLNENRLDEALAVIAPLGERSDADLHVLSAYALALKAHRRFDEAIAVYRRAVEIAPKSAAAEHNLAAALGDADRFAEAELSARRAFAKGIDAPQTWLALARALQGQDRFDEAETAYAQAIRRRGDDPDAHTDLAQLFWMRTGDVEAACTVIDAAIDVYPASPALKGVKARVLEYAGDRAGAYAVLGQAIDQQPDNAALHVRASHLAAWSDPERALDHARRALALSPDALDALSALCLAQFAAGDAAAASELAATLRARSPLDQMAVALQATAWRLLGDPRYEQLHDYGTLVRSWTLDTPPGWTSLEAFLSDLAQSLTRRQRLLTHPIGQSLRHGAQTQQRLDRTDDPVIQAFFQAIDGPIRRHLEALGQGVDPVRARNAGGYKMEGIWSVRLRPGGYHTDHLHAKGWLSSACYIALPPAIEQGEEGWLRFGQPGVPTDPVLAAETAVKPAPGKLVLFPSYMWHGTVPFSGQEPRLTIAFDLLPVG